jgi:TolB protein
MSEPLVPKTTQDQEWDDTGLLGTRVVCVMPRPAGERGKDIVLMDYGGPGKQRLIADGTLNLSPSLSPDGSRLAYTSYREGTPSVYLRHLTTGAESRLTPSSGLALPGSWSPNGRYLALSQSIEGNSDVFLYDTVRQHLRRLTSHSGIDVSPHFAPDNTRIVFTSDRSGSPQLYLTTIEGRTAVRLTRSGPYNTAPAWSPHNETIAFIGRSPEGSLDVYTIQADGTNLQRLTSGRRLHKSLTWAPDGRFVMSSSQQGAVQERHLIRTDGQGGRVLPNPSPVCQSPQWVASPLASSATR